MWIRCNPNPLGKQTSDCVVRAIAIATEQSWKRTYRELCELGEIECEMPNANYVWGIDLREKGARQFLLPESCPACITVRAFCEKYPDGIYVIGTGSHAVAVIDGDYYDSWDSGNEVPSYFWRVK
jgi:hypothetical protein